MLIMALDVGTSSARALCFDGGGRAVPGAEARVTYEPAVTPYLPDPGRHVVYRAARERQQRLYDNVVGLPPLLRE